MLVGMKGLGRWTSFTLRVFAGRLPTIDPARREGLVLGSKLKGGAVLHVVGAPRTQAQTEVREGSAAGWALTLQKRSIQVARSRRNVEAGWRLCWARLPGVRFRIRLRGGTGAPI